MQGSKSIADPLCWPSQSVFASGAALPVVYQWKCFCAIKGVHGLAEVLLAAVCNHTLVLSGAHLQHMDRHNPHAVPSGRSQRGRPSKRSILRCNWVLLHDCHSCRLHCTMVGTSSTVDVLSVRCSVMAEVGARSL